MTWARLVPLAAAVRLAIEKADRTGWACFQDFPRGTCGIVSEVLARLLRERFALDARYVAGVGHPNHKGSHAWVEVPGVLIDITADQFGQAPVIVTPTSQWHDGWVRDLDRPPCMPDGWPMYPFALWATVCKAASAAECTGLIEKAAPAPRSRSGPTNTTE